MYRRSLWNTICAFTIISFAFYSFGIKADETVGIAYFSDWSRDGATIAVATISQQENALTIYNADLSIRSVWRQNNPDSRRSFFGLSPDGSRILTEGEVWDTETFQPVLMLPDYYPGAWNHDGSEILAVPKSELGFVTLSSQTGQLIQSYMNNSYNMVGPVWSGDNHFFVVSDPGKVMYVVEESTGTILAQEQRTEHINTFAWHPDSTHFVFAEQPSRTSGTSAVYRYDLATQQISQIAEFDKRIIHMQWSPDGNQLLIYAYDTFYFLDSVFSEVVSYTPYGFPGYIDYSPSGAQITIGYLLNSSTSQNDSGISFEDPGYVRQSLFAGSFEVSVPVFTLGRFAEIADFCDATSELSAFDTSLEYPADIVAQAQALMTAINALPEGAISLSCTADLRAIAEAIIAENTSS